MTWQELDQTFHYVEKWAAKKPETEVMVFENERLSWKQFKEKMDQIAKAYLDIGVERGDKIALISMARTEFLTTYMAAGKVGAIWLGLTPKFTLDELRYQIGDAKPTVLIAVRNYLDSDLGDTIATIRNEFSFIKKILVIGDPVTGTESFTEFTEKPRTELDDKLTQRAGEGRSEDSALLLYTSGSTGKPKGVVHTHRGIIENIRIQIDRFESTEDSKGLLHFPINHVAADTEIGFATVLGGGSLVMSDKFDPKEVLTLIEKEKINQLGQVPVMYLLEFKEPDFFTTDFSSIDTFIWAGAAAPKIMVDILMGICEKNGAKLMTGYGTTETCGFITYTKPDDSIELLLQSAGKIADPFELKIVDNDRNEIPDGEIGEIAVRGPFMMEGYLNNKEETEKMLDEEGWYYTSDLAHKDKDGYIFIAGRSSEMFKSGGENVYPREIEDVIESHDSVLFAAVIGVKDELFQEIGWGFVMLMPGKTAVEEELRELCKSKLANFKVPKRFFIRELLPLLGNGKIDKLALKEEIKEMLMK